MDHVLKAKVTWGSIEMESHGKSDGLNQQRNQVLRTGKSPI